MVYGISAGQQLVDEVVIEGSQKKKKDMDGCGMRMCFWGPTLLEGLIYLLFTNGAAPSFEINPTIWSNDEAYIYLYIYHKYVYDKMEETWLLESNRECFLKNK